MRKKVVETCEMCSVEVKNPTTIKVEGALLRVCPRCTSFGNVVEDSNKKKTRSTSKRKKKKSSSFSSSSSSSKKSTRSRSSKSSSRDEDDDQVLVPDYGKIVRKARMKKKLTQEQLSNLTGVGVAYIKSIEAEKIRPTERVVTKLERELNIDLFEEIGPEREYREKSKGEGTTVGDIVNITRREFD